MDSGCDISGRKCSTLLCDEEAGWFPAIDDIRAKVNAKTKAIVVINPNNPTGAVYSKELLEEIIQVARENNLIIFADEIYDKILYDVLSTIILQPLHQMY